MISVVAHPFRAVVFPLAAPFEVDQHPLARVVPRVPERFSRLAEIKEVAPISLESGVQFNTSAWRAVLSMRRIACDPAIRL